MAWCVMAAKFKGGAGMDGRSLSYCFSRRAGARCRRSRLARGRKVGPRRLEMAEFRAAIARCNEAIRVDPTSTAPLSCAGQRVQENGRI